MPDRFTTVATWARAIVNALEADGCDSQSLFDELGLDSNKTYDPNARYPTPKVFELLLRAAELSGDPEFSLKVSRHLPQTYIPALGLLVASSDNLYKGLEALCRFFELVNDAVTLELEHLGDSVFLTYRLSDTAAQIMSTDDIAQLPPIAVEVTFAGILDSVRNTLDPQFSVKNVCVSHSAPDDKGVLANFFNAPVHYDQPYNRLELDYALLCKPLITANPELVQLNEQVVKGYLDTNSQDAIVTQTQLHILDMLPRGEPSQEEVAKALFLSSRQLRRKLQQSGTNYAKVLQETRHDLAKKYLAQAKLPLVEITQLLGFRDQSNFSKAFKRWEGSAPASFRKLNNRTS